MSTDAQLAAHTQDADGRPVDRRPFEERMALARGICAASAAGEALKFVPMERCNSRDHLSVLLDEAGRLDLFGGDASREVSDGGRSGCFRAVLIC